MSTLYSRVLPRVMQVPVHVELVSPSPSWLCGGATVRQSQSTLVCPCRSAQLVPPPPRAPPFSVRTLAGRSCVLWKSAQFLGASPASRLVTMKRQPGQSCLAVPPHISDQSYQPISPHKCPSNQISFIFQTQILAEEWMLAQGHDRKVGSVLV